MKIKSKAVIKICVDIAMTITLLLLMPYQLIGEKAHEWIGVIMFFLFVVHHILNRAWSRNILRGKYTARRVCQTVLVISVLLCMIGSMISGIILSRYVFAALDIHRGIAAAGRVHMLCAYWGMLFMSIHLGFHWDIMLAIAGKAITGVTKGIHIVLRVIAVLIPIYGVTAFVKRDIWNYMTLKNHFAFFDMSEPIVFFLLDYLSIMGLFVAVGYCLSKSLSKSRSTLKNRE